jgi:hypothetical protein
MIGCRGGRASHLESLRLVADRAYNVVEQFVERGEFNVRVVMKAALSRDGVLRNNRRCTEGLFGEQSDGIYVAKTIREATRMVLAEPGSFPVGDSCSVRKRRTMQRALDQSSAQRTTASAGGRALVRKC